MNMKTIYDPSDLYSSLKINDRILLLHLNAYWDSTCQYVLRL